MYFDNTVWDKGIYIFEYPISKNAWHLEMELSFGNSNKVLLWFSTETTEVIVHNLKDG